MEATIENIIRELIDVDTKLATPLFKAKFLSKKIKNVDFEDWVNLELNGYPVRADGEIVVPDYRKYPANVMATFQVGFSVQTRPLPPIGMNQFFLEDLSTITINESIVALEDKMKTESASARISVQVPTGFYPAIQHHIDKLNPEFGIIKIEKIASAGIISQTLTSVRSRFLDFMMAIDDEFGNITDFNELSKKNDKITTIMQNKIYNYGDGNFINTGNDLRAENNVRISKSDYSQLANALAKIGVPTSEIEKLGAVIDDDDPNRATGKFGSKVNAWISGMLAKSLDGTWQLSVGAAGNVLGDLISSYYGWN